MTLDLIADLKRKRYNATLTHVRKLHSDLMVLRVTPDKPPMAHAAGQFTTLGMGYWEPRLPGVQDEPLDPADEGKLIRRSYSIACPMLAADGALFDPQQSPWLEFYVSLVREGDKGDAPALTPRLFMLREHDRLHVGEKITGHYTLAFVNPTDSVVFLATGTGEAPHNYMLWELLRRNHLGRILSATCVRNKKDVAYRPVHEELMKRHSNYRYLELTTREVSNVGQKVYIQDLLSSGQLEQHLGHPLEPGRTHVYLCGNPKMIGVPLKDHETGVRSYPQPLGVIELLENRGFTIDQPREPTRGSIHFEEYW